LKRKKRSQKEVAVIMFGGKNEAFKFGVII
jgi:hypothetical protein